MRLSDRGFTSTRGLSYTLADTAANVDAALPITHGLGALPSSLELWVEVSAGEWEQHDASTYVTASSTALTSTGTTLASVVGGATNVRLVASSGAIALSVEEASLTKAGIVSTGTQSFAGVKTFASDPTFTSGSQLVTSGAQTIGGAKTFTGSVSLQNGNADSTTTSIGADSAAFTVTDATNKIAALIAPHYSSATEEPVGIFLLSNTSTENSLRIGSSSSNFNSPTEIRLYTAANNTTVVGTERVRVDSAGNVGIGTPSPATKLHSFVSSSTAGKLLTLGAGDTDTSGNYGAQFAIDNANGVIYLDAYTSSAGVNLKKFRIRTGHGASETGSTRTPFEIDTSTGAVTLGPSGGGVNHVVNGRDANGNLGNYSLAVANQLTNGTDRAIFYILNDATNGVNQLRSFKANTSNSFSGADLDFYSLNTYVGGYSAAGAWTLPLIHNIGAGNITSGRYTPTLTSVSNIASATAQSSHYSRVGNTVTVAIWLSPISATAAAGTITRIRVSLPIASNFTSLSDALGTANFFRPTATTAEAAGMVLANVAGNDLEIYWRAPTTSAGDVLITAQYEVK